MANLWQISLGTTQITVQDYFDPNYAERVIALDPELSGQENAGEWFEKARKARGGAEIAKEQCARAKAPIERLQEALAQVEAWEEAEEHDTNALKALHKRLRSDQLLPDEVMIEAQARKNASEFQGHKIRRVMTPQGYEVLIGETATANDFLLTRLASPNDLWFHVRASASAHVIVRTNNRPDAVPRTVIEAAALLCARHSSEKHASIVPVDYTLRKYVRKPRGSAPGYAHYERESTLHITP
jgi:predicted ribosome quality control (RQC) complex YloA/Tae2 family protein